MLPVVHAERTNGALAGPQPPAPLVPQFTDRAATALSSPERSDVTLWRGVLAAYSAALEAHRSFLVASSTTAEEVDEQMAAETLFDVGLPDMFDPPDGMPPFPEELAPLVEALLSETEGLVRFAEHQEELLRPARLDRPAVYDVTHGSSSTMDRKL